MSTAPGSTARTIIVEPAPRREPLFDDEAHLALVGPFDRQLPFPHNDGPPRMAAWPGGARRGPGQPDLTAAGRRLVLAALEHFTGRRGLAQLAPLLSPAVLVSLTRESDQHARLRTWGSNPVVRSLRVSQPRAGAGELCAVVRCGERFRAVAARLELIDGQWRCTRLQTG